MHQFLDLYGFGGVALRAAGLAARTALLRGVAFRALLLLPAAPRGAPQPRHRQPARGAAGGVVAPAARGARWTEPRAPAGLARTAAAVWPASLIPGGASLLVRREA